MATVLPIMSTTSDLLMVDLSSQVDGTNTQFVRTTGLLVYVLLNGVLSDAYTASGLTVTFTVAPIVTDTVHILTAVVS